MPGPRERVDHEERQIIDRVVQSLDGVASMSAIVLGGSRARDTATQTSDYDIGLYIESVDQLEDDASGAPLVAGSGDPRLLQSAERNIRAGRE